MMKGVNMVKGDKLERGCILEQLVFKDNLKKGKKLNQIKAVSIYDIAKHYNLS